MTGFTCSSLLCLVCLFPMFEFGSIQDVLLVHFFLYLDWVLDMLNYLSIIDVISLLKVE